MKTCGIIGCDRTIGGGTLIFVRLGRLGFKVRVCEEHWQASNDATSNDAYRSRP